MPIQTTNIDVPNGNCLNYTADTQTWVIAEDVVLSSGIVDAVWSGFWRSRLVNLGTLVGGSSGNGVLMFGTEATVVNAAGAEIFGGTAGVTVTGANSIIDNQGGIHSSWRGVNLNGENSRMFNGGTVYGYSIGVEMGADTGKNVLVNDGEIGGANYGVSLDFSGTKAIVNRGFISGEPAINANPSSGAVVLTNTGEIQGEVQLSESADVVRNQGLIDGDIVLRGGDDLYDGRTGAMDGFQVWGGLGGDTLRGGAGEERLYGEDGADLIQGRGGEDYLNGGVGADLLSGGAGGDLFAYERAIESDAANGFDHITDFKAAEGDRISFDAIDAKPKKEGVQDFVFIGTAAFTNAGQLRYVDTPDGVRVEAELTGDNVADLVIHLDGVHAMSVGDFIL